MSKISKKLLEEIKLLPLSYAPTNVVNGMVPLNTLWGLHNHR
jgi:hypothetical protein